MDPSFETGLDVGFGLNLNCLNWSIEVLALDGVWIEGDLRLSLDSDSEDWDSFPVTSWDSGLVMVWGCFFHGHLSSVG